MGLRGRGRLLAMLGCGLLAASSCLAQGRPGGGGPPGGGQSSGGAGGSGGPGGQNQGAPGQMGPLNGMPQGGLNTMNTNGRGGIPPSARGGGDAVSGITGSLQLGPVGRWWDDKKYTSTLGLRPEQKKRMDAIFNGNRGELTDRVQALRQEEAKLEAATRDTHLAHESIFGQIDRVAEARDALERVNTRLMESLRKELDADQVTRMQSLK